MINPAEGEFGNKDFNDDQVLEMVEKIMETMMVELEMDVQIGGIPNNDRPEPNKNVQLTTIQCEWLYERFGRMRPLEFEGSTNPLNVEEWLSSIEIIMDFMEGND